MIYDLNWCIGQVALTAREKKRTKNRKFQARLRADPVRYALFREKSRVRCLAWWRKQPKKECSEEKKKLDSAKATAWRKANRERYNAHRMKVYHTNPHRKVAMRFRGRLWQVLKGVGRYGKARVTSKGLGFDKVALKEHLERKFLPGMTWENHGTVWHIDHIVPCASFDLTKIEEVKKCFALSNIQPLWSLENIKKSNKIPKQAELSLAMPGPTLPTQ